MSPLIIYGYIGMAVFGMIMLYRIVRAIVAGSADVIVPQEALDGWTLWRITRTEVVLGRCYTSRTRRHDRRRSS